MAEKKSQTLVRAEGGELAAWKEAATIRGLSLNQFMVEAANRSITVSGLEPFANTGGAVSGTVTVTGASGVTIESVMLAYDVALNQTPTLTGQRKWVDPTALREEFATLLATKSV